MEILNIGPQELIFILTLMIVLLGPNGMKRLAWQTGVWIRKARQSSLWKDLARLNREARDLPVRIVREAGFEEQMAEIRRETQISIPLTDSSTRLPGEVRSPGKGRLRPPQQRYNHGTAPTPPPPRTDATESSSPSQIYPSVPDIAPEPGAQTIPDSATVDEKTGE